jgi:serine/threonine-protein kinase
MSNQEKAARHFESERVFLFGKMDQLKNDSRIYRSLGIAYAGLGMKNEAIEQGEKALDILNFSNDAISGFYPEMDMVKILLMVGEYDEALIRLDHILNQTNLITVEVLKLDPFWDPVRDMDTFKEIISNPKYQIDISEN